MKTSNIIIALLISFGLMCTSTIASAQAEVVHDGTGTLTTSFPAPCDTYTATSTHIVVRPNGSALMVTTYDVGECLPFFYIALGLTYPQAGSFHMLLTSTLTHNGIVGVTNDTHVVGNSTGFVKLKSHFPAGTF